MFNFKLQHEIASLENNIIRSQIIHFCYCSLTKKCFIDKVIKMVGNVIKFMPLSSGSMALCKGILITNYILRYSKGLFQFKGNHSLFCLYGLFLPTYIPFAYSNGNSFLSVLD